MEVRIDDVQHSMAEIASRGGESIVSLLVKIQESQRPQKKYLEFLDNLECLSSVDSRRQKQAWSGWDVRHEDSSSTPLFRHWINAFDTHGYVALSYTWSPSSYEDKQCGRYAVQTRDGARFYKSTVRDIVFDRVLGYMSAANCGLLWIDRHCIPQRQCNLPGCTHNECRKKQVGLQTMDLVYKLSKHPVALLARPVQSDTELKLFAKILAGRLVGGDDQNQRYWFSRGTRRCEMKDALTLLKDITTDLWWTRAWTFQENYRAAQRMTLLIPHAANLENLKRSYADPNFGTIRGELRVRSVDFSYQATRLCLAIRQTKYRLSQDENEAVEQVLRTAGKYTILLANSCPMSPTIITDIGERTLREPWDRLPITANCCQYPIRLDTNELQQMGCSLSVSILAMCLLNGEILYNGRHERAQYLSAAHLTVAAYIKAYFFDEFHCPQGEQNCLTFNKSCRFFNVKLEKSGILTEGHLWHLGELIHTDKFVRQLPWIEHLRGRLSPYQRKRLAQLANELRSRSHNRLAEYINDYLHRDFFESENRFSSTTFSKEYMHKMAEELVVAMEEGETLRLGCLWGIPPYDAIFIWRDGDAESKGFTSGGSNGNMNDRSQRVPPSFVFTASRPMEAGCEDYDPNDIDRHVSLEVEHENSDADIIPRLYIKRWLPGLCFFPGQTRQKVIFPWPASLRGVSVVQEGRP